MKKTKSKVKAKVKSNPAQGKLSAEKLQEALWETLGQLRSGDIKASNANAIATQSREICRITKMQIEVERLNSGADSAGRLRIKL